MFGLTVEKLLLIGVIAVFLVGPQRLPVYAAKPGATGGWQEALLARVAAPASAPSG